MVQRSEPRPLKSAHHQNIRQNAVAAGMRDTSQQANERENYRECNKLSIGLRKILN